LIARPALEVAQERLAEVEQGGSSRTKWDPCKISITRGDHTKSDHLRHIIVYHDRREFVGNRAAGILSEPLELIGEFNDEKDYDNNAIKRINNSLI
jgi:hypothetical protein